MGDELWIFNMIPRQKDKAVNGKLWIHQDKKKARMQRQQMKVMLITFFDHQAWCIMSLRLKDKRLFSTFVKKSWLALWIKLVKKGSALWASKIWILHHDNAPANTSLSMK